MTTSIFGWKPELTSPLVYTEEDVWLFSEDEEKQNDLDKVSIHQLSQTEIAEQLLEDYESLIEEGDSDTFSQWFEKKVDLPIFDEIESVLPVEEFKPVIESVDEADLTPPDSPYDAEGTFLILDSGAPPNQDASMAEHDRQAARNYFTPPDAYMLIPQSYDHPFRDDDAFLTAPPTPVPDLEKEMAVVDEVVRSTAQNLNLDLWESDNSNSQSSVTGEEESDDPEWVPVAKVGKPTKIERGYKPYSQQDRWLRKKEQNKNAATRYRQKKKAETSEIFQEEKILEEKKGKLLQRVSDIQLEIQYLKGLMREFYKAKGLLTN